VRGLLLGGYKNMKIKWYNLLLFISPAFILYTIFVIYPFISSIYLSFFSWVGVGAKKYVGLKNFYDTLFGSFKEEFFNALWHNIYFFIVVSIVEVSLGFIVALGLATQIKGYHIFRSIIYIPNVISMVLVGFIWGLILNPQIGLINQILKAIGLGHFAKAWLGDPNFAFNTIIAVNIWRHLGFYVLVMLAAIINIQPDFIEAAYIDGANNWNVIKNIIIPLTIPTAQTLILLLFIWSFSVFELIYALEGVQAGPFRSTDVLGTLFYRTAFGGLGSARMDLGLGAAIVTLMFLIILPVSFLYIRLVERRR